MLSGQIFFFLFQMRDHQLISTWVGRSRESTVTSCFVTSRIYAEAVTDAAQETVTQKDFHAARLPPESVMRLK